MCASVRTHMTSFLILTRTRTRTERETSSKELIREIEVRLNKWVRALSHPMALVYSRATIAPCALMHARIH